MSKIIENAEKTENADVICNQCIGTFQRIDVVDNKPKIFNTKFFQKWIFQCNACGLQTKIYCSRIIK